MPTPILLYDFSNINSYPGSGTIVTDLVGTNNGNLNGTTYGTGNCVNNYLEFDGINDYLITNDDLNPLLDPPNTSTIISLFTWVYPIENGVIVSEHESAVTPDIGWHDAQIEMISGTMCFAVWPYPFNTPKITSSISTPFNEWHYVGLTYDGTTLKAYVNGQLAGTATYSRYTPYNYGDASPLRYALGYGTGTNMSGSSSNYAKMRVGTFEVYNVALTSTEVLDSYNNSSSFWQCCPCCSSTNLLYLDAGNTDSYSGSGTTWNDLGPNNNDATNLTGFIYDSSYQGFMNFLGSGSATIDSTKYNTAYTGKTIFVAGSLATITPGNFRAMLGSSDSRNFNFYFFCESITNEYKLHFSAGGFGAISSALNYNQGDWFTAAVTQETDGTTTFYFNGQIVNSTNQTFSQYVSSTEFIGRADNYWYGALAVICVDSTAFTANQISQMHNSIAIRYPAPTAPTPTPTPMPTGTITPTPTSTPIPTEDCLYFMSTLNGENIITIESEFLIAIQNECAQISHKLKRHGHNKLTNRGDRFIKNTKRIYKNIFHRIPGSAYNNDD